MTAPHAGPLTAIAKLRAHTAPAHDAVDAAFGAHDLTDAGSYRRFLLSHALALPAAEAAFADHPDLPRWRERTTLLAADLADLGETMPTPLPFALPAAPGAAWGALYVTEGSRLGGIMLARGVPATLPSRYLGARHESGEWRTLLAAIDAAGAKEGEAWIHGAVQGADACFALYGRAA